MDLLIMSVAIEIKGGSIGDCDCGNRTKYPAYGGLHRTTTKSLRGP